LPLEPRPGQPRGGMIDPEGWTPDEIFNFTKRLAVPGIDPFVQVNHPRSDRTGYFSLMGLDAEGHAHDPRFSPRFDGVEIVSLGYPEETRQAREDWFALLRRGRRITGIGTSDSHTLTRRPSGWPRTLVCVEDDRLDRLNIAAFTRALKKGCATMSAGPVVTIRSGQVQMGGLLSAPSGRVPLSISVQAAKWIKTDLLTLYVDGRPTKRIPLNSVGNQRFDETLSVRCAADCFVLAEVTANASLEPVVATRKQMKPAPIALTNPIYVDVNHNGRYDPPTKSDAPSTR
ncbi:MAG: CehA/McbA family metallohydrolase, partial [Myxococcota bacterium]